MTKSIKDSHNEGIALWNIMAHSIATGQNIGYVNEPQVLDEDDLDQAMECYHHMLDSMKSNMH